MIVNSMPRFASDDFRRMQTELSAIVSSLVFRKKQRAKRLITYLVRETVEGRAKMLDRKDVHRACFDGYGDEAIASTEKFRLNRSLELYYKSEGRSWPFRVRVKQQGFEVDLISAVEDSSRPFVGREHELEELHASYLRAKSGQVTLVWIAGEPGIGKTRLVESFLAHLPDQGTVFIGRSSAPEARNRCDLYLPIQVALRDFASTSAYRYRSLQKACAKNARTWLPQVFPEVYAALVPPSLGEIGELLSSLSAKTTLVLFLDDLHLADESTAKYFASITRRPGLRVLIIASHREPEFRERVDALSKFKTAECLSRTASSVCLQGFNFEEVAIFVAKRFPGADFDRKIASAILHPTGGNPLYLSNLLDHFVQTGLVRRILEEGRPWALTVRVEQLALEIPRSVELVIDLVLSSLESADRDILLAGALQGEEFESSIVARTLSAGVAEVESSLQRLCRFYRLVDFLKPSGVRDGSSARYRFSHALHQRALVKWLEREPHRTRVWASLALTALKEMSGVRDQDELQLAALLEWAGKTADAVSSYLDAARRGIRKFAHFTAGIICDHALSLVHRLEAGPGKDRLHLDLLFTKVVAITATRGYADSDLLSLAVEALRISEAIGDLDARHMAHYGIWNATNHKNFAVGLVFAEETLGAKVTRPDQSDAMGRTKFAAGISALHAGRMTRAVRHLHYAHSRFSSADVYVDIYSYQVHPSVIAALNYARALSLTGRIRQAYQVTDKALEMVETINDPKSQAYAWSVAAVLRAALGDSHQAETHAIKASVVGQRYGFELELAWAKIVMSYSRSLREPDFENESELRAAVNGYLELGVTVAATKFLSWLADVELRARRPDSALATTERALRLVCEVQERYFEGELLRLQAIAYDLLDNGDEAITTLQRASTLNRKQGVRLLELRSASNLLELSKRQGRRTVQVRSRLEWLVANIDAPPEYPLISTAERLLGN